MEELQSGQHKTVDSEIAQHEDELRARTEDLEQQIFALEDELSQMYREIEDRMRAFQDESQQLMWALDDRRYQLEEQRRTLEEEMQDEMENSHVALESERQEIEEQLATIRREELHPLEEEIDRLELELEELYVQERAMEQELRTAKQNLGPMEQQMENKLLDLLETAVGALAQEKGRDLPPSGGEDVGLTESEDVAPTLWYLDTDADGYGTAEDSVESVTQPPRYVLNNIDCDDTDTAVNPGAFEAPGDEVDNNCDGIVK